MKNLADRLPFEVLCIIFEYYVAPGGPSRFRSQETLLLVSRSWYEVASNHTALWRKIDLSFASWYYMEDWGPCLARRLVRYSGNALIDIHITVQSRQAHHQAVGYARAVGEQLLLSLVGESGTIARRWRTFVVDNAFAYVSPAVLAHCLSFPTPNLQEFGVVSLRCDHKILPNASSLKSFSITESLLPNFPNLENVTNLEVTFWGSEWDKAFDEHAIGLARNLQSLKLGATWICKLRGTYCHLKSLELQGGIRKGDLTEFYAPNLNDLTLILSSGDDFHSVVSCAGIQLHDIQTARIGLKQDRDDERILTDIDLCHFLTESVNLETLTFHDSNTADTALTLLTSDCEHLYQSHTLHLVLTNYRGELGKGDARLSDVDRFRELTGCNERDRMYISRRSSFDFLLNLDEND